MSPFLSRNGVTCVTAVRLIRLSSHVLCLPVRSVNMGRNGDPPVSMVWRVSATLGTIVIRILTRRHRDDGKCCVYRSYADTSAGRGVFG